MKSQLSLSLCLSLSLSLSLQISSLLIFPSPAVCPSFPRRRARLVNESLCVIFQLGNILVVGPFAEVEV